MGEVNNSAPSPALFSILNQLIKLMKVNQLKTFRAADSTNRRWSVASSGYSTTTGGSNV